MILIEHATVLTLDRERRILTDGSILVDGRDIIQVGPAKTVRPPRPPAGASTKSTALQGPAKLASKTVRLHKAPTGRSASPVHDEMIANDTVVYFDRNGHLTKFTRASSAVQILSPSPPNRAFWQASLVSRA